MVKTDGTQDGGATRTTSEYSTHGGSPTKNTGEGSPTKNTGGEGGVSSTHGPTREYGTLGVGTTPTEEYGTHGKATDTHGTRAISTQDYDGTHGATTGSYKSKVGRWRTTGAYKSKVGRATETFDSLKSVGTVGGIDPESGGDTKKYGTHGGSGPGAGTGLRRSSSSNLFEDDGLGGISKKRMKKEIEEKMSVDHNNDDKTGNAHEYDQGEKKGATEKMKEKLPEHH